jgi:hypothetical protein
MIGYILEKSHSGLHPGCEYGFWLCIDSTRKNPDFCGASKTLHDKLNIGDFVTCVLQEVYENHWEYWAIEKLQRV